MRCQVLSATHTHPLKSHTQWATSFKWATPPLRWPMIIIMLPPCRRWCRHRRRVQRAMSISIVKSTIHRPHRRPAIHRNNCRQRVVPRSPSFSDRVRCPLGVILVAVVCVWMNGKYVLLSQETVRNFYCAVSGTFSRITVCSESSLNSNFSIAFVL